MSFLYRFWGNWPPAVRGLVVFFCALIVTGFRTYQEYIIHFNAETRELISAAYDKKEALQSRMREAAVATSVLSNAAAKDGIASDPGEVAKILIANNTLDMLGLVRGEVLTHVYPLTGNEKAVGKSIFDVGTRNGVFHNLGKDQWYAAGPNDPIVFGAGVLVRRPYFIGGKQVGFAIAAIRPSSLFKDSTFHSGYQYQISRVEPQTGKEHFFLPQSASFDTASAVKVSIPDSGWKIYARHVESDTFAALIPFILMSVLLSCLAGIVTWYVAVQPYKLQKLVIERTHLMGLTERKYQSLFEQASDAILVHDPDMNITKANNAMARMFGYSNSELLRMKAVELFLPGELERDPLRLDEVFGGKQLVRSRLMLKSDGTTIEVSTNAKTVSGDMIMVILRDVTDLRKAERKIVKSEATLQSAFEYSAIGMAIVSLEGTWVKVNRELCYMLGYSEQELLRLNIQDITHPDDIVDGLDFMRPSGESTIERYNVEKRYIHKNGAVVWVNLNSNIIKDETGTPLHFVVQIEDVTQKRESELNFRLLIEKSLMGVYIVHDGKFAYVNPRIAEISGYRQEELINTMPIMNLVHPEDVHLVEDQLKRRIEGERQKVHYEVKGLKKDGSIIWLEVFGSATVYKGAHAIIGTMEDVTDRKVSANIILHEKSLSDTIINGLPGIFYVSGKGGRMLRWNKNLETILGYDAEEIATMRTTDFVDKEHLELAISKRAEAFASGRVTQEIKIIRKDGKKLIFYITIMPISYDNQDCILGIGIDYTEKKAAETLLLAKNSEIRERNKELLCLYRLAEISNDASYSIGDVMTECVRIIPAAYQFPEITCAKIELGKDVYASAHFTESAWKQASPITNIGSKPGKITVYYTEERPGAAEGPFLAEERHLLDSVADILSSTIMRRISNEDLAKLNSLYEHDH